MMEYYSVLKRNELSSHEKTWRKLKCILLKERRTDVQTIFWQATRSKTGGCLQLITLPVCQNQGFKFKMLANRNHYNTQARLEGNTGLKFGYI